MKPLTKEQYYAFMKENPCEIVVLRTVEEAVVTKTHYLLREYATGHIQIGCDKGLELNIKDIKNDGLLRTIWHRVNTACVNLETDIETVNAGHDKQIEQEFILNLGELPIEDQYKNRNMEQYDGILVCPDEEIASILEFLQTGCYIFLIPYSQPVQVKEHSSVKKIQQIDNLLCEYSQIDGAHHKAWCLDQIARIIHGDHYEEFIKNYESTDDQGNPLPEDCFKNEWDCGIAP